jgi:hypothetical protein
MREIISKSTSWGRIRANVMFHFTSKYSLTLYELICLRAHLKYRSSENFELEDFRSLLGVPIDKLKRSPDLTRYCIQPATLEINKLSDMGVQVEPIRRGGQQRGAVKGFKVTWWPKNGQELKEAWSELRQSRVGRKARMTGTVEEVDLEPPPRPLPPVIETPAFPSGKQATNRIEFRQPINAEDQRRILLPAGWQIDGNPERWKGGTFTAEVMELYSRWGRRLQGG